MHINISVAVYSVIMCLNLDGIFMVFNQGMVNKEDTLTCFDNANILSTVLKLNNNHLELLKLNVP